MSSLDLARRERARWGKLRKQHPGKSMSEVLATSDEVAADIRHRSNLLKEGLKHGPGLWEKIDRGELTLEEACKLARKNRDSRVSRVSQTTSASQDQHQTDILRRLAACEAELKEIRELATAQPDLPPPPQCSDERIQAMLRKLRETLYFELREVGYLNADLSKLRKATQNFLIAVDDDLQDLRDALNKHRDSKKEPWLTTRDLTPAFKILGLEKMTLNKESFKVIKKAYRRLAANLHPDRTGATQASTEFLRVQEAYATLNQACHT